MLTNARRLASQLVGGGAGANSVLHWISLCFEPGHSERRTIAAASTSLTDYPVGVARAEAPLPPLLPDTEKAAHAEEEEPACKAEVSVDQADSPTMTILPPRRCWRVRQVIDDGLAQNVRSALSPHTVIGAAALSADSALVFGEASVSIWSV